MKLNLSDFFPLVKCVNNMNPKKNSTHLGSRNNEIGVYKS